MFRVGDVVRIRSDLRVGYDSVIDSMLKYAGEYATIVSVKFRSRTVNSYYVYKLDIDNAYWSWLDGALESPTEHSAEDLYEIWGG